MPVAATVSFSDVAVLVVVVAVVVAVVVVVVAVVVAVVVVVVVVVLSFPSSDESAVTTTSICNLVPTCQLSLLPSAG